MTEQTERPYRRSSGASNVPGKMANPLDPDIPPWERQPDESENAYAAFLIYRDLEQRSLPAVAKDERVSLSESSVRQWSARWSWGYRAYEWDRFLSRQDEQEMVRYRLSMNKRQRDVARVAQSRIMTWLANLDPAELKATEAARWYEVAVRVEREAAGALLEHEPTAPPPPEATDDELTFEQLMGDLDLSDEDLAMALHQAVAAKAHRQIDPRQ